MFELPSMSIKNLEVWLRIWISPSRSRSVLLWTMWYDCHIPWESLTQSGSLLICWLSSRTSYRFRLPTLLWSLYIFTSKDSKAVHGAYFYHFWLRDTVHNLFLVVYVVRFRCIGYACTTFHPQTNCQLEHTIQFFEDILRVYDIDFGGHWDEFFLEQSLPKIILTSLSI